MLSNIIKLCECGIKCPELEREVIKKIKILLDVDWSKIENDMLGRMKFQHITNHEFPRSVSVSIIEESLKNE